MMNKLSTTSMGGESGANYKFEVYPYETMFRQGIAGVYLIAKRYKLPDGKFTLDPIYIGELSDLSTLYGFHKKQDCFLKHGANCKCIYISTDQKERQYIVQDLIEYYEPRCNE